MSKKLSRKASDVFGRVGLTTRTVRRNLSVLFDAASDEDLLAGLTWYDEAHEFAVDLARATDTDITVTAAVIAAFSPQTRWSQNKGAAIQFLKDGTRAPGMLISNYQRAIRVRNAGPMGALAALQIKGDESAPKIAAFARNILGDETRVTIDVWATRAALGMAVPQSILGRVGMYEAIADQYRWLADKHGIQASQAQAIVWTVLRGKAD